MVFPVVGGDGKPTGYDIDNSLLFNGANQYLERTPSSAGNRRTFTTSWWSKLKVNAASRWVFGAGTQSSDNDYFLWQSGDLLKFSFATESSGNIATTQVFRDPAAWYHCVIAVDTTQSTASNRVKFYLNGTQITSFGTETYPSQNYDTSINNTVVNRIGARAYSAAGHYSGLIAEMHHVDGQQLAPTVFGEVNDNGVWIPKDCKDDITYGTNGFFLEFKQSGTSANSSGIGADTSGNDNHFSVNAHGANSTALDTPTNNFCTLNPLIGNAVYTAPSYGVGNLTFTSSSNTSFGSSGIGTMAPSSGKWYWEARINTSIVNGVGMGARVMEGYYPEFNNDSFFAGNTSSSGGIGYSVNFNNGHPQTNSAEYNTGVEINGGSALSTNDIIGVAMDLDNGAIYYAINGTWQASSNPESGASKTNAQHTFTPSGSYAPAFYGYGTGSGGSEFDVNFGGAVSFNVSSATSDTAGYGKFEYAVPDGYYALCTKNLGKYG